MSSNVRKSDSGQLRTSNAKPGGETKPIRKAHSKKLLYRVGYNWNKGGRLKELRTRHLARKFLKIWTQKVFGRILPHKAKLHNDNVVLRRAFEGWKEEWWTSRREWSLTMRAECHYRYYLYNLTIQRWRTFLSLQREKKRKLQNAQIFADRQQMRLVWERWEVFTEMRQMKNRMLTSALEHNSFRILFSAWNLWRFKLQQHYELYSFEVQAQKQHALTSQRRTWHRWKKTHTAACCQKEKESMASLHFILKLKSKTLHQWMSYVSFRQAKKNLEAGAQQACYLGLLRACWSRWSDELHRRRSEEERLRAAGHLAVRCAQRRALEQWKAYVKLCREEAERSQIASQHHNHHLLIAGLQGLSLHVIWNKARRLNNNMAVQHHYQSVLGRYWKLWQKHLEEAEDKSFQPITEMAQTKYSLSLLKRFFQHWREKNAQQRHMQELEHSANIWFAVRLLPRCFNSWVEFTLQRKLKKQRRHEAEVYNQRRQYTWGFYTWWERSDQRRARTLTEGRAILHEKRCHMRRAWALWRRRTQQHIDQEEKENASHHLYLQRLVHGVLTQWKHNSSQIRDRRHREQQACRQGNRRCVRLAVERWKKLVQSQRVKKKHLEQMQHYHEVKLVKRTFGAWKTHHLQMSHIYSHAEKLYRQQTKHFLRTVLSAWRETAELWAELRQQEQRARNHWTRSLRTKVFRAWREAAARAVLKRQQQEEAVGKALKSINQVRLLRYFRRWRKQTRAARRERMCLEKARRHRQSKLLFKALEAWKQQHIQRLKYKVMKRQGVLLLRLKMYQIYFEQWKIKLQHRRRETKETERALWHWSLNLQAKVLYRWRMWVTEERRKREQAARAAQVYRDELLKEGVTCILTYAAHMSDLTTSLTQFSQEQKSRRLQRAVRRCATRWKQRALFKSQGQKKVRPPKKSVTFCVAIPAATSVSSSDAAELVETEDEVLGELRPPHLPRRPPRRYDGLRGSSEHTGAYSDFNPPSEENRPTVKSRLRPATLTPQKTNTVSHSELVLDPHHLSQAEDLLLPPSAFMSTGSQIQLWTTHGSDSHLRGSSGEAKVPCAEDAAADPASALTRELMKMKEDMKSYQQDRTRLREFRKLKKVFEGWLQTSRDEDPILKREIYQEVNELDERIDRLSVEVAGRKPTMLLHAERIQHLQTVLHTSAGFVFQQEEELEAVQKTGLTLSQRD